jgi:hypothetical protein
MLIRTRSEFFDRITDMLRGQVAGTFDAALEFVRVHIGPSFESLPNVSNEASFDRFIDRKPDECLEGRGAHSRIGIIQASEHDFH